MKSASLSEIKKELQQMNSAEVIDFCLTLAKYKKDNKELLTYILFESGNRDQFVTDVKAEIQEQIEILKNQPSLYLVKKSLRKVVRLMLKYSRYINNPKLSAEIYICFCQQLKNSGIPFRQSQLIVNLYEQQLKKIHAFVSTLHEDLQYDYLKEVEQLEL